MTDSVAVVIAAKNESFNIGAVVRGARRWGDVLVVDNASWDGTPDKALAHGADVLIHNRDTHIARSYIDGLRWGMGHDRIIQLDAGLSFDPAEIGTLLEPDADLVIGKRSWRSRKAVSLLGSMAVQALTGMPYADVTSGFRCWRSDALGWLDLNAVTCKAHGFQIELLWQAWKAGLDIKEVNVSYVPGRSSANRDVALEALRAAWRLRR